MSWQQFGWLGLGWGPRLPVRFRASPWTIILGPGLKGQQVPEAYPFHSQLLGRERASQSGELTHSFRWPSLLRWLIFHWPNQVTLLNPKSRGNVVHSIHHKAMVSSTTWREWRIENNPVNRHCTLTLGSSPKSFAICFFSLFPPTFLQLLRLTHYILLTLFCWPFRANDGACSLSFLSLYPCCCFLLTQSSLSLPFLYLPAPTHARVFNSPSHQCKCHLLQDWLNCSFSALPKLQHLILSEPLAQGTVFSCLIDCLRSWGWKLWLYFTIFSPAPNTVSALPIGSTHFVFI